jgi:hypothetical protein
MSSGSAVRSFFSLVLGVSSRANARFFRTIAIGGELAQRMPILRHSSLNTTLFSSNPTLFRRSEFRLSWFVGR